MINKVSPHGSRSRQSTPYTECRSTRSPTFYLEDNLEFHVTRRAPPQSLPFPPPRAPPIAESLPPWRRPFFSPEAVGGINSGFPVGFRDYSVQGCF